MNAGLFLCRAECIGFKSVDVDAIAREHADLAAVRVFDNLFTKEAIGAMIDEVKSKGLEGVVLAACSPHYFLNTLAAYRLPERLEEAGVNPNLIAFANLREQCALPNRDDMEAANRKARLMVDKALARVRLSAPVETVLVAPHRAVLVIGATLGGIVGAYRACRLGYRVFLLDRAAEISAAKTGLIQIQPAISDLELNPQVEFLLDTDVAEVSGWCGDFTVEVTQNGKPRKLTVGGVLVAVADDREWAKELAPKLHVKLDEQGNIRSRNDNTMATRTDADGIFSVSLSEGDDPGRFQVAAASTATTVLDGILSANEIAHPLLVTEVDRTLCGACGTCVKTCAYHACSIDPAERISVIDERRCKACGNCVTACPTGARDLITYPNDYIAESIKIYSQYEANATPKVLCFLCDGCGYPAADAAGLQDQRYPASILPLRVACGGRVDTQHILEAYWYGFDGVMVTVCREGHCHNIVGNVDMARRVNLFRAVLDSRKLNPERLRVLEIAPFEGRKFAEEATRFVEDLTKMG